MGLVKFVCLFVLLMHGMELKIVARTHEMNGLLSEERVEQIFINCGVDWVTMKNGIQNSSSLLPIKNIIDSVESKPRDDAHSNGNMFDCLVKQRFPLPNLRDEKLKTWLLDYLSKLLKNTSTARRNLANQPSDQMCLSPSPSSSSVISLDSINQLSPPTKKANPPKKKLNPHLPKSEPSVEESEDENPETESNTNVTSIVALTAVVTASVVALMFFCFYKCRKRSRYYEYRRNSDRPLLSLTISDFPGSSKSLDTPPSLLAPPKPLKNDPCQNARVTPVSHQLETLLIYSIPEKTTTELSTNVPTASSPPPPLPSSNVPTNSPPPLPSRNVPTNSQPQSSNVLTNSTPPPIMPPPFQKPAPPPPQGSPAPPKACLPAPSKASPPPPKGGPPPPPPKVTAPPRAPPQGKINISRANQASPLGGKKQGTTSDAEDAPKPKLKPFFWEKVHAKPDQSMVWDRLKAGSFQFNEEMIESLFSCTDANKDGKKATPAKDATPQYVKILDPRKAQNLAISLKAMNVKSEEVCEALKGGNELPAELLHTLLKMAPTTEEELKIRLFADPSQLGPAEQFLHGIVDIPFAFERMEALLFMSSLQEESSNVTESFSTIEAACTGLRNSRLFLKLLEATLKTGNRMNDGTYRGGAQAFKLETLLKLADVKGVDGKTTLLHFVVLEIIRTEGIRASRNARESHSSISSLNDDDLTDDTDADSSEYFHALGHKVVSGLSGELQNVKKASALDADALMHTVATLGENLLKMKGFLKSKLDGLDEESRFVNSLRGFVEHAEADITKLLKEERRISLLVKSTTDYFNGDSGKDEGLKLFVIVGQFLDMIDKVCREVKVSKPVLKMQRCRETPVVSPIRDPRQLLFPAIKDRRADSSSSSSSSSD